MRKFNSMPFVLWRQDDNGQRFPVATFAARKAAEARLAELDSKSHRQIYWIEPDSPFPDLAAIKTALSRHTPLLAGSADYPQHRRAAVALLLRETERDPEILYLLRAKHDRDPWSGDIGFPGGHIDAQDPHPRAAAERETREEIGLDLAGASLLGQLDDLAGAHLPIIVSCFVYQLPIGIQPRLNHEVVETFWVPLQHLCDPLNHRTTTVFFRGETLQRPAIDLLGPGRTVLWGITYRLTVQLLTLLGRSIPDTPIP